MFDQKMFEYAIYQNSWKNALEHKIVRINLDWEVKEVLFDIVKRKSTPSEIIETLKDKYWGEDTPEINQLIEEIKINMEPGAANNNVHTEEEVTEETAQTNNTTELTYTVEIKDWDNLDSYPQVYTGSSMTIAMMHFKEQHLNGQDVILFIEDEEGNTIDTLENYGEIDNVLKCQDLFPQGNKQLIKDHKEAVDQKNIYNDMYTEQLNRNDELSKRIARLQGELRTTQQQLNKLSTNEPKGTNNLHWYAYRLRGFSPFCQPKGHIEVDHSKGRHGIIAYDRPLTDTELYEYELVPYNKAI